MTKPYVYKWTNTTNDMWYIGKHNGKRKSYTGSGVDFKLAYNESKESFIKEILFEGDYKSVSIYEVEILKYLDAANDPMSYNRANSGGGVEKHSNETKAKMKASHLVSGREYKRGNEHYLYGIKRPEHSLKVSGRKNGRSKGLIVSDVNDIVFDSSQKCAEHFGVNQSTVSRMISGKVKNKYGLKYID